MSFTTGFGAVITGVNARASSEFGGRGAINAVNGSGLSGNDHGIAPTNEMWLSASGDTAGTFEVDLGAVYNLDSIQVWNYNENANATCCLSRGVQTGTLDLATTYNNYSPAGPVAFDQAPGTVSDFSQTFPLGGVEARFLRLNIANNYGDASFTGLSEIRFEGTLAAVQPPGTSPLTVLGVVASSSIAAPFNRLPEFTIDGSGLFGGATHSTLPEPTMWLSASGDTAPDITWDLGSVKDLSHMKVWNYNENANPTCCLGRGINNTDVYVSDDDITYSLLGSHDFAIAPGDGLADFSETLALNTSARFVRFDILSNHGDASFTGLSEVQFFAVPEPSAALLLGLSALGLVSRRRR